MAKLEKGHPKDTTDTGAGKESFKPTGGKENKGGNAPRQDGKNNMKGPEAHSEAGWKQHHSEAQGPING